MGLIDKLQASTSINTQTPHYPTNTQQNSSSTASNSAMLAASTAHTSPRALHTSTANTSTLVPIHPPVPSPNTQLAAGVPR